MSQRKTRKVPMMRSRVSQSSKELKLTLLLMMSLMRPLRLVEEVIGRIISSSWVSNKGHHIGKSITEEAIDQQEISDLSQVVEEVALLISTDQTFRTKETTETSSLQAAKLI